MTGTGEKIIVAALMIILPGCGKFRPAGADISFERAAAAVNSGAESLGGFPRDQIGYMLYDLESRKIVREHNRDRAFIPASTTKVPVTVAALDILGPDYRFTTSIAGSGPIDRGVLNGDIWLKGTGDPLLTVSDLMDMADRLREKGVRSVSGHFYYDESDLVASRSIDNAMEPDVSFNSGLSALSLEYNSITAEWKRDKKNGGMNIFLTPSLPSNSVSLAPEKLKENVKFVYSAKNRTEAWLFSPEEKNDGSDRLPVKDPARYTAYVFAKICGLRGIALPAPEPGTLPSRTDTLCVHYGMPLSSIADLTLTYSINLMAELMALSAAKKLSGKALGLAGSASAIAGYYSSRMERINWKGLRLVNGSGLTVRNRITPEQMMAFLVYADAQDYLGKKFISFLPVSGWKWSLHNRFQTPDTQFRVWAKTGSINYALALAGYLFTASNHKMAFVIFMNDIDARRTYDADPDRRSRESMRRVYAWQNNAKNVMDSIVTGWIRDR